MAAPIPLEAPVTTATLSASFVFIFSLVDVLVCELSSVQIEQERLRRRVGSQRQGPFFTQRRSVARAQSLAIQGHFALGHLHPGMATRLERVGRACACVETGKPHVSILMKQGRCARARELRFGAARTV